MTDRKGDWMQTYSGSQFWPLDPRPDEIKIVDIAHSLGMACRYAGHSMRFYSVAEHCVHIARWLDRQGHNTEIQLKGLMHDATEAYLVDVPRPVKPHLGGYIEAELGVWQAVAAWLGISNDLPMIVHEADNRILVDERAQNMSACIHDWNLPPKGLGIALAYWSPARAKVEFLREFQRLRGDDVPSSAALIEEATNELVLDELAARVRAICLGRAFKSVDDALSHVLFETGGGAAVFDVDSLDEAAARFRRREYREMLWNLEKGLGPEFAGLSDIKPEHLA